MLSPQALLKGIVSRLLVNPTADGQENERLLRLGKYGEAKVESVWATDHPQADEGSMIVAALAPGATALQLGISAAFSATAAAFVLYNSDNPGPTGKSLFPKWLKLAVSTVGTTGIDLRYAIVLDTTNRSPTTVSNATGANQGPGTAATATAYRAPATGCRSGVTPNTVGVPYFPLSIAAGAPPAVPGPGPAARQIVGNGYIKNTALVAKDQVVLQFGSADIGGTVQGASAVGKFVEHAPALVVDPGHTLLLYLWSTSNATAGNAFDDAELVWDER